MPDAPAVPPDVSLTPFYRTHGRTYSVYFDVLTPQQFDALGRERAAERERQRRIEAATIAFVRPGDPAADQQFNYQTSAERPVIRTNGRAARGGPGWFSYDLPIADATDAALVVTYLNDLGLPVLGSFDLLVDGQTVATYQPNRSASGFWDAQYGVPQALVRGKTKITVRLQASGDGRIAPVYGVRLIRQP